VLSTGCVVAWRESASQDKPQSAERSASGWPVPLSQLSASTSTPSKNSSRKPWITSRASLPLLFELSQLVVHPGLRAWIASGNAKQTPASRPWRTPRPKATSRRGRRSGEKTPHLRGLRSNNVLVVMSATSLVVRASERVGCRRFLQNLLPALRNDDAGTMTE